MRRPRLNLAQMFNMSFGFLGIQFGWGLQLANMSAVYEKLGARPDQVPLLWLAAPVTGLLVQPIVGALSDRTWGPLGRRRPYFLTGAILASIALFIMPTSSALWMAATLLWILDASINISMEPFRAFVADKLDASQRTAGFVMQSFFIGVGASLANALPLVLSWFGVQGSTASGVPLSVKYSFQVGAAVFLVAVLWTVMTTSEFPPEDPAAFDRARRGRLGLGPLLSEISASIREMPATMRQLAVVQLFTWLGLFCMWLFFVPATARHVFGATDPQSALYTRGIEWGGFAFAFYSITCFVVALALPKLAQLTTRKKVHAAALLCGAAGLFSVYLIHERHLLLLSMVGVGIAWASILSMPYAILSTALPAHRMGVYMGIFNFFIVIPEIIASVAFGPLIRVAFGTDNPNAPLYVVMLGGVCLTVAAGLVTFVRDVGSRDVPEAAVIAADAKEAFTIQESIQPVPSSGLVDGRARRGFTLLEMLVVLVVMGMLAGLVAPAFIVHPEPDDRGSLGPALRFAREAAVRRSETVYLQIEASGAWRVDGASATPKDEPLGSGQVADFRLGSLTLVASPLGTCAFDARSEPAARSFALNPLTCELDQGTGAEASKR